eukprot:15015678-Alexandrium_andersonii.AAC.1
MPLGNMSGPPLFAWPCALARTPLLVRVPPSGRLPRWTGPPSALRFSRGPRPTRSCSGES